MHYFVAAKIGVGTLCPLGTYLIGTDGDYDSRRGISTFVQEKDQWS